MNKNFIRHRLLTMAIVTLLCNSTNLNIGYGAEEADEHEFEPVVVEGQADLAGGMVKAQGDVGFLGKKAVMDTPFNTVTLGEDSIKNFAAPGTGIVDVLTLNPSVRSSAGSLYNDISIRGFNLSGHNMYINGIPGLLCQENIPYNFADSITVVSGPNLGIASSTLNESVGGMVNIQSKTAGDTQNASVKIGYRGGNSFEQGIDIGNRFGKDKQWGIRVNANNIDGETAIDNEKLEQQNIFINVDHESEKSKSNLLIGYNHTNHHAGAWGFSFDKAVTSLPGAPDSSKNYKPDWSYNEYDNWLVALNHEEKLADNMTAFFNAGYHREDWYGYIDGSPTILNNNGDFKIGLTNYPLALTKKYIGVGVKGEFTAAGVKNNYLIGLDKNFMNYDLSSNKKFGSNGTYLVTGNINQNNWWPSPNLPSYHPAHNQDAQMTGWHLVDTLSAPDDKLQVTMGLHGHNVAKTPVGQAKQKSSAICPTFGVSYKVTPDVMVYANHAESFGMGSMVSTTNNYANGGEILDPSKTKQNELGIKVQSGKFLNTLSLFEIKQANNIDVYENSKKYLRTDGEQKNKGVEWTVVGSLSDKVDLLGGIMYLDAKQAKTANGSLNGQRVNGAAEWSGSLGIVYKPVQDLSWLAKATYLGSSTINNGSLHVPSYCKFDVGASYKTKLNNTPVTIDAMCYNVTGKDYWNARSGNSSLTLGAPRTFVLSATLDI